MNNHKHLTDINTITSLLELIFYVTKTSIKTRKLSEGVSETDKRLEAHMALPKIAKDWTSAGMGMLVAAGLTLGGVANDAKAQDPVHKTQISEKLKKQTANWNNPELEEFHRASTAARDYAENNVGVGILIHVGQDVPNKSVKNADELGQLFVRRFTALGVNAKYFLRQNGDAPSSGVTYHIGHLIHGAGNGNEVKGLKTAWNSAPDVVEQMKIVKQLAVADAPAPKGG